jgi:hypothetical protein
MSGPHKPERSARSTLPGTGKPHECPICGRRVADKRSLRQHVAAAHPEPAEADRAVVGASAGASR